jgi:hypothetical protein
VRFCTLRDTHAPAEQDQAAFFGVGIGQLERARLGCQAKNQPCSGRAGDSGGRLEAATDAGGDGKAAGFVITLPHGSFLMNADPQESPALTGYGC